VRGGPGGSRFRRPQRGDAEVKEVALATASSAMKAMSWSLPPQSRHARTSAAKTLEAPLQAFAVELEDADARVEREAAMIPRPRTLVIRRIWPGSETESATMDDGSP
jgi:hypothetical protein